jgi:hypothetical protein
MVAREIDHGPVIEDAHESQEDSHD